MDYEYTPLYYSEPTQVYFYVSETDTIHGGIAYHDFIIDGHSGEVRQIEDIIANAAGYNVHFDRAIVELGWVSLEQIIIDG